MRNQGSHVKTPLIASPEFVGGSYGGWVTLLPSSWVPYIQLTRLNISAPIALSCFPHLFGVIHAAATDKQQYHNPMEILHISALLFGWTLFCSNAGHAWDDLIDAHLDAQMERTKHRPIPRGAISPYAALTFSVMSIICASVFLFFLPVMTAWTVIPSVLSAIYYPWAKKHTPFPQLILGFCLAWGVMVGKVSLTGYEWKSDNGSVISLMLAYMFAIVIYDTIYAHQDINDDLELGLGSTAVLFRNHTKRALFSLTICMTVALIFCGVLGGMGFCYLMITVGGSLMSVGIMLYKVDLNDRASCWLWFSMGFWTTMLSITIGLLSEYMLK